MLSAKSREKDPIAELIDINERLRVEIRALVGTLLENYARSHEIRIRPESEQSKYENVAVLKSTIESGADRDSERLPDVLNNLSAFAAKSHLDDDVYFDHLIGNFLNKYAQIFVADCANVRKFQSQFRDALVEWSSKWKRKSSGDVLRSDYLFYVLKRKHACSLLVYDVPNGAFYHYESNGEKTNTLFVRDFVLQTRHTLNVERLVNVVCETRCARDANMVADILLRIIFSRTKTYSSSKTTLTLIQLANLPSQADCVEVIVVSYFILSEIKRAETLLAEAVSSGVDLVTDK